MIRGCLWILMLIIGLSGICTAQNPVSSTLRNLSLDQPIPDSLTLDTLLVLPATIQVTHAETNQVLDSSRWTYRQNTLFWRSEPPEHPITINYRVLPFPRQTTFSWLDSSRWINPADAPSAPRPVGESTAGNTLFGNQNLDYSGSFARGLSFGNRQNLVLNSAFNLQLAGDLGDDFSILAAITDENIPLQPEGNTQQLRDFDRVYVQINRGATQLTAGDYELSPSPSYFMRFFKNLQGATVSNEVDIGNGRLTNRAGIAITRGQFARQNLPLTEGNQGPYRLQGNQGERFIIVLAGTERVYLNGRRLTRGIEQDYVIDYNLGEITFTAQVFIKRESRVIVEFEYADQNYLRSLSLLDSRYESQKATVYAQWYRQQDSRNSTLTLQLSEEDRDVLFRAGDDPEKAVVSGVQPLDNANPTRATYRLTDTLSNACPVADSVLVFTTRTDIPLYTARFSFVGNGKGNYRQSDGSLANEPVYEWIPPDPLTCEPRGDYAPVIQLPTPQQQQLLVAGAEVNISERSRFRAEWATSSLDLNRFSPRDDSDDGAAALYTQFQQDIPLSSRAEGWNLTTDIQYEFKEASFQFINPYRPQEFLRTWSLTDFQGLGTVNPADEHLIRNRIGFNHPEFGYARYGLDYFSRGSGYSGLRHGLETNLQTEKSQLLIQTSLLNAQTAEDNRSFWQPDIQLRRQLPFQRKWTITAGYRGESNRRETIATDSLQASSYAFREWWAGLEGGDSTAFNWQLEYERRTDQLPQQNTLASALQASSWIVNTRYAAAKNWQLKGRLQYRSLEVNDRDLTEETGGNTFLGRLQQNLSPGNGIIRLSTVYELGTGQEPRIDFTYIRVATGEGQYIWLDSLYNNDGLIQPNEMEIAPFPDQANYVRVSRVTNDFIRTRNVMLNQSVSVIPRILWFSEKDNLKALLARFSTQSSLRIQRKTSGGNGGTLFNPFQLNVVDSNLVALSSGMQHTLFFNRGKPVFESQVGLIDNRSRIAQTTGFESRQRTEYFLRSRLNLDQVWNLQNEISRGKRISDSELFDTKNFALQFWSFEPSVTWTPSKQFRWSFSGRYQVDQDQLRENGDEAISREIRTEVTYNRSVKTTLRGQVSLVGIEYSGNPSSPVGFAILNGLQPGRNVLWNLQLDQQLGKNLRLSLSYEGRQTGSARTVHVGRAQVAAVF